MAYVIKPVIYPADLTPKPAITGQLGSHQIVRVPGGGRLHPQAARAYAAIIDAAKKAGFTITYSGDPYRDYAGQEKMFRDRYAHDGKGGGGKFWSTSLGGDNKMWYKKNAGYATAAVPGTSNHGLGLAVDTSLDFFYGSAKSIAGTPADAWLQNNVLRFGFSYETVPSEPWHIRLVCGDNMPQAVLDYERSDPIPLPPIPEEDMKPVFIQDSSGVFITGDWVTRRAVAPADITLLSYTDQVQEKPDGSYVVIPLSVEDMGRMRDVSPGKPMLTLQDCTNVATAVVAALPAPGGGTIDTNALARAVADELARRMVS